MWFWTSWLINILTIFELFYMTLIFCQVLPEEQFYEKIYGTKTLYTISHTVEIVLYFLFILFVILLNIQIEWNRYISFWDVHFFFNGYMSDIVFLSITQCPVFFGKMADCVWNIVLCLDIEGLFLVKFDHNR